MFDAQSEAVFHIGEPQEGAQRFAGYGGVTAIDGENGVIGFFTGGLIYLVNRDFLQSNTFTLHSDRSLAVFRDGEFVPSMENTLTVSLGAGEAVLLQT